MPRRAPSVALHLTIPRPRTGCWRPCRPPITSACDRISEPSRQLQNKSSILSMNQCETCFSNGSVASVMKDGTMVEIATVG